MLEKPGHSGVAQHPSTFSVEAHRGGIATISHSGRSSTCLTTTTQYTTRQMTNRGLLDRSLPHNTGLRPGEYLARLVDVYGHILASRRSRPLARPTQSYPRTASKSHGSPGNPHVPHHNTSPTDTGRWTDDPKSAESVGMLKGGDM